MLVVDGLRQRQSEPAPVLGHVGDPVIHGLARAVDLHDHVAAPDRPAVGRPYTEQRLGDLGASRPDEAGETEHFAFAHFEVHVLEGTVVDRVLRR